MKKKQIWPWIILFAMVMAVLIGIQIYLNQDTERLKKEQKKYATFDIKTKSGEIIKTKYYNFKDGSFYLKIPNQFKIMDEETKQIKYPNNSPSFVYTNEQTTVNIVVNITETSLKNSQVKDYLKVVKKTFADYEILSTKTTKKDNYWIGLIEFISQANDTDIYNHMMFFSSNQKLIIISFNCTKELQKEWQTVGDFIMNSIMFPVDEK